MDSSAKMISFSGPGIELYSFGSLTRSFPPHFHKRWLIGCLARGKRLFWTDRQKMLIAPGDLVILPPFASHACEPAGAGDSDWLCAHVEPVQYEKPEIVAAGCVLAGRHDLCAQFRQLAEEAFTAGETIPQRWNSLLADISASVQAPADGASQPVPAASFAEICSLLASYPGEKISLAEMASAANQGKFSFLRGFRASRGITPSKYLVNMRLIEAQKLLKSGCRLAECAIACGFYDQSHFSRFFKAILGVPPGVYRASCEAEGGRGKSC